MTDAVLASSIAAMPAEYREGSRRLIPILRVRRDSLHSVAMRYYGQLFKLADIHGTEAADNASITRNANGTVRVTLQSGDQAAWFDRTFDPADTREIRLYLHGGDDKAIITGESAASIRLRVIGGNGTNTLTDESAVGGRRSVAKLYDQGTVSGVKYAPDSILEEHSYVDALNSYYNRRPWVHAYGGLVPPQKDFGSKIKPVFGLKTGHGLGLVPRIGIARYGYGFRKVPYANMIQADIAPVTTSPTPGIRPAAASKPTRWLVPGIATARSMRSENFRRSRRSGGSFSSGSMTSGTKTLSDGDSGM
jgi:hypothetical protein